MRSLKHPNVIDIYQFFKDDPKIYYVSIEYMRGGELFDRIVKKVSCCCCCGSGGGERMAIRFPRQNETKIIYTL